MFILFVCLVSMNLLMIRTEEDIVSIEIKREQQKKCVVDSEVNLHVGEKFTLQVRSDYFIKNSFWQHEHKGSKKKENLKDLENSKFSITYERTKSSGKQNNTFVYTYSHTGKADDKLGGKWRFTFKLLTNYDPWSSPQNKDVQIRSCSTLVEIDPSKSKDDHSTRTTSESVEEARSSPGGKDDKHWLIALVSVLGILLFVQSSFIIFGRVRSCKSNRNNDEDPLSPKSPKTKRGSEPWRNIADRPPLSLPYDEVVKEGSLVPKQSCRNKVFDHSDENLRSPGFSRRHLEGPLVPQQSYRNKFPKTFDGLNEELMSPGFPRRQIGPLVPNQSYKNKALDNSDEELRSPDFPRRHEGPLVPKQSYRNKALDISEEKIRTPSFARRHLEAQLAQLPPKGVAASKSFELPKPAPPLHPKNLQVFPPPVSCIPRSIVNPDPRLSDADWQYEILQPACIYLDNCNDTPYNNL